MRSAASAVPTSAFRAGCRERFVLRGALYIRAWRVCTGMRRRLFDRSVGERFLNTADHQHITAIRCEIPALDWHDNGQHASTLHSTAARAPLGVLHRRLTHEALWAVNQATNLSSVGPCHPPQTPLSPRHNVEGRRSGQNLGRRWAPHCSTLSQGGRGAPTRRN